jgi:3-oxoacyl-[acyl-carrier protein] reductase
VPEGRSVLVTGADRGIGRAIAAAFVAQGDRVVGTYRTGRPEDVPEGALAVQADVTDTTSVDAAFARAEEAHGPVEVLVANAGVTRDALLLRMSEEDFTSVVDTNLIGTFRVVKRATKGMMRAKFGRIVLMSSVVGMIGQTGQVNYAASKSALIGMARSITRELGSRGITANVVAPGYISTAMTDALPEAQQQSYQKAIPAGRFGAADEVAGVVAFLASDAAGYISGAVVPVDGGLGMGH